MNTTWRAALRRNLASSRPCRTLALVTVAASLWACPGGEDKPPPKTPEAGHQARDTEIAHESCDLTSSGAVQNAVDGQGPVIISVMDGSGEACRAVDLNRDGVIDVFVYFDANGQERRRESAFGRDGLPNEVALFEGGVLVRKERETNNDSRIDTWDFYEGGRLVREERDSTGDGYVDQWWTFDRPGQPECAIVLSDDNGDGKADEGSRIDMCADLMPGAAAQKAGKAKQPGKADATVAGEPASAEPASADSQPDGASDGSDPGDGSAGAP